MIDISIIIPCYNAALYIDKCIRHICNQTFTGQIEIIFIDDCSTDDTILSIETSLRSNAYNGLYSIIRNSNNKGVAIARITGIKQAKGQYILFCDSDDWMETNMCQRMYDEVLTSSADLVICDYRNVYESDSNISLNNCVDNFLQGLLLCKCTGSLWNKLIKRELLINDRIIYPQSSFCEDYVYSIQLAILAKKIRYVAEPLYNYYHRPGSIVMANDRSSINKRIRENLENHRIVEQILKKYNLYEVYNSEVIALKLIVKNSIRAYLPKFEYYFMWLKTYPEVTIEMFKSRHISIRSKIAYFITMTGLYPLFKKYIQ